MAKKFPKPSELKKKKPAPAPEPEEIDEDELEDEPVEDDDADTSDDAESSSAERKIISWNQAQDDALILAIASGAGSIEEITAVLKIHPAFKAYSTLVTEKRVATRLGVLRHTLKEEGVELPRMKPRQSSRYQPDAGRLARLLRGEG